MENKLKDYELLTLKEAQRILEHRNMEHNPVGQVVDLYEAAPDLVEHIGDSYDVGKEINRYAFPGSMWALIGNNEQSVPVPGMTKREYFAGLAMQGLLAGLNNQSFDSMELTASSVRIADELLTSLADLGKQINE